MTQAILVHVDAKSAAAKAAVSGEQRKITGQALALEKAGKEWVERFTFLARTYLTSVPVGAMFAFEDIRAYCEACELTAPSTHKVWGPMPRVLIKAGLPMAMTDRSRKAHSPKTHAHRVPLYVKTGGAA